MKLFKICILMFILSFSSSLLFAEEVDVDKLIAVQKIQIVDRPLKMVGMGMTQKMSDD